MPRPPHSTSAVANMPGRVFSPVGQRLTPAEAPPVPLNVGDTWMEPFEGGRMEDLHVADHPGMHRYSETQGIPALVDALVEKLRTRNGIDCDRNGVLVSAGATGALASVVGMLAAPGEEILILAPFWPLIRGIVQSFRAVPVEVPFFDRVDSAKSAVEAVRMRITEKTVALYVSSPSNPTGRVMPRAWLEALAALARSEDLWLLSDEVYEDYVYRGEHVSVAPLAPERTLSVYSFSKAYGMAGNRVGYLVGPPAAIAEAEKISTHTFYHSPTASQLAALAALRQGRSWVDRAKRLYREAGEDAAAVLGLPPPEGLTVLFVDVRSKLGDRGLSGFLSDCFDAGVALAPGSSCGADYEGWVRVCYTSAPPDQVKQAVRILARLLA